MNWHEHFSYNKEIGVLCWKERPCEHFPTQRGWRCFNSKYANKVAGKTDKRGCVDVSVNGKYHKAHRIIWEMYHGPIPRDMQIDHVDLNPSNNRLSNLRLATNAENSRNRPAQSNNACGAKGVFFDKSRSHQKKPWVAQIGIAGRSTHIGRYASMEEAHAAYSSTALLHHGQFTRTS